MVHHVRRVRLAGVVTLLALFALLSVAQAATTTVSMKNFQFAPQTITINVGDTITWQNNDQVEHTAQADDGSFNSDDVGAGKSFSFTFTKAGSFPYYCKYHGGPGGKGMSGVIMVQAAAQATTAPAPSATTAPAQGSAPTGSITVSNQAINNGSITVSKATISQDGWIAVHKAGPDGKLLLTPLVGLAPIKAGDNTNVVIKLTEPVAVGAPLWPMLHIDEGIKGTYEFPNGPDVPVVANGMPVMQQIMVQQASAPTRLPNTGGEDAPLAALALSGLALLVGGLVIWQVRRHNV